MMQRHGKEAGRMRWCWRIIGGLLLIVFAATVSLAQPAPANQSATEPAAAPAAAVPRVLDQSRFPPTPTPFFRGNLPIELSRSGTPQIGWYLNLWRFVPFVGLFFGWIWLGQWVNEDSNSLKVNSEFWNSALFAGGMASMLVGISMSPFWLGFVLTLALQGLPLGLYIRERNACVPESARLLTPKHIKSVVFRLAARLGIHLGGKKFKQQLLGPDIEFVGKTSTGRRDTSRTSQVENSRGFLAAKELVYDALIKRATDIHLEPKEDELQVRLRVDGVMYSVEPFDRALGDNVVNIFKILAAMDITEKRKSLDGSFRAITGGREIDFRVATQGTRDGEKMTLRILDQSNSVSTLADLGFRKQLEEQLKEVVHQPHGLLLVCGPTGAGKSTTLYACLNDIDSFQQNIITIEDPVEYKMNNVTQIEINTKAGQTFANSLRSVLRQDPDIVMIGEIRDGETANISCQAANTGHMVFSTVHANDAITALYRMIDLGVDVSMLSSSLSAILAQRLARRLCTECKESYVPKPEFLKKANLPAEKIEKLYRPPKSEENVACPNCGGMGYRGRVGVYELLVITDRMRDLIREKAALSVLKAEARKGGMLYMQEEGLRLVVKGITSIDELLRVVK
jgi:type II secretory ATPase GspE/PulE/Tfp pilus assembly ATPase PilB-like protein